MRGDHAGLGDRRDHVIGEDCAGREDSRKECSGRKEALRTRVRGGGFGQPFRISSKFMSCSK